MQWVTSFPLGWSVQQRVAVEKAYETGRLVDIRSALRQVEQLPPEKGGKPVVIGILRTFTMETLLSHLQLSLSLIPSVPTIVLGELENIEQELLDTDSDFIQSAPDLVAVLWRLEDLHPRLVWEADAMSLEQRLDALNALIQRIQQLVTQYRGDAPLILSTLSMPQRWIGIIHDQHRGYGIAEIVNRVNQFLYELASKEQIKIFDFAQWVMSEGGGAIDQKMDLFARQHISATKALSFSDAFARVVRPLLLPQSKVLAVDLDNTLWGGVLGEDGIDNLKIGQDHPGSVYWRIQQLIHGLKSRGVLLVLLSKNNAADVEEAFSFLGKMPLQLSDFSVVKTNWNEKYINLIEVAEVLNLGIDSFVFLDDQPFEQEQMRRSLPEVKVLNNRNDPLDIMNALLNTHLFDQFAVGEEDQIRNKDYQYEAERDKLKKGLTKEEFLLTLELKAEVQLVTSSTIQRTVQMLSKTNQFNLTTRRHSEATVRKIMEEDGNLLLTLSLSDRFGDQGIVGLCIALKGKTRGEMIIDSFLLSCRALGRGAEDLLWSVLLKYLDERKCTSLQATYAPSKKNIQVSELYERLGMVVESTSKEETQYRMRPPYFAIKPAWIEMEMTSIKTG